MTRLRVACAAVAVLIGAPALAAEPPSDANPPPRDSVLTWTPEQQLYGYRHMDKVTDTRVVKRGAHVRTLPPGKAIDPTWTFAGKTETVAGFMAAMNTSGLVVLKDGKVVLERYGLGRKPDERWTSFSVAKSLTSTLVGAAIKDGSIKNLDAPVTDYIPELKGGGYEGVTVRQLLTMTSGVRWNESYTDPNSDVARAGIVPGEPGMNPLVSYMRRLPNEAAPGAKWVYKTGETDLAGIVVSKATGKSLSAYLSEKIWAPYGMEQDAIWVLDASGHERGGCCLSMALRDYARVGQFMLEGGAGVLPDGWVAEATRSHHDFAPGDVETGYGYFWWVIDGGYSAEGIFGQQVFVYPAERVVVAINSAWPVASNSTFWLRQKALAEAMRAAAK